MQVSTGLVDVRLDEFLMSDPSMLTHVWLRLRVRWVDLQSTKRRAACDPGDPL